MEQQQYYVIPNLDMYGGDISKKTHECTFVQALLKSYALIGNSTQNCVTIVKRKENMFTVYLKKIKDTNHSNFRAKHNACVSIFGNQTNVQLLEPKECYYNQNHL